MTRLFNNAATFAEELLDGFALANPGRVRRVEGGVVRAAGGAPGTVAVVIGGGSGHYPAFGGLVGTGMAHGAAMGNLFASPSAKQVRSVSRAAENGAGVLFVFGRYAGDLLNFGQAEQQLIADGIRCRTVPVTDDICCASPGDGPEQIRLRRGLAGGLVVIKAAATAAEAGYPLDEVARVAEYANVRTRTIGVAFGGCTLPGATQPLFTIPGGRMAVGMGVHGEPGVDEQPLPTADDLAGLLVGRILADVPGGPDAVRGTRAAVVLNGLGSVKYEELFVVFRRVAGLLADLGVTLVEPEIGEFFTSFDMPGLSLTVTWLDEELESFWRAPADAPGYRKLTASTAVGAPRQVADVAGDEQIPPASETSSRAAKRACAALDGARAVIDSRADELGRVDAIAGDGDHGIGMQRGITAATADAKRSVHLGAGLGTTLRRAADAWAGQAGGTSGALWGAALYAAGGVLGDQTAPDTAAMAAAVLAAEEAVRGIGHAEVGDKTMVDALVPFRMTLQDAAAAGTPLAAAWMSAAGAAEVAATATARLEPRVGRARTHSKRSLGTPDPGAVSFALVVQAIAMVLTDG